MLDIHGERVCSVLIIVLLGGSWKLFCISNAGYFGKAEFMLAATRSTTRQPNFFAARTFLFFVSGL